MDWTRIEAPTDPPERPRVRRGGKWVAADDAEADEELRREREEERKQHGDEHEVAA